MKRWTLQVVTLALLTPLVGCAGLTTFPAGKLTGWLKKKHRLKLVVAGPEHPVERIICVWQPGEGRGLDNLPCRGFAGQIFFFTHSLPMPVVGNGMVQVFLFDDQGPPEEQVKPLHVFEFTREAWNQLLVETQLGPAYNVFIPYVRKGMHEAECALVVRLVPEDGSPPVLSDMAYIRLPGLKAKHAETEHADAGSAKPSDSGSNGSSTAATRTETIQPPLPLARKLADVVAKAARSSSKPPAGRPSGRLPTRAEVLANVPRSVPLQTPVRSQPSETRSSSRQKPSFAPDQPAEDPGRRLAPAVVP